jgi:EAL domain-containing protein (putative c-di-GMP-specific phosphodiesterase class I)
MASKLGYTVICEGLENKERINRAIEAGCTTFQSEFYAKACSERFFLNMIKGRA